MFSDNIRDGVAFDPPYFDKKVVPAFQCRGRLCNAEKRHTRRYGQVCDHPESTGIGIMLAPGKAGSFLSVKVRLSQ